MSTLRPERMEDMLRKYKQGEYVVYRCPDDSILLVFDDKDWRYGYPTYPKHKCVELERGICEGGPNIVKVYAEMKGKYVTKEK